MGGIRPRTKAAKRRKVARKADRRKKYPNDLGIPVAGHLNGKRAKEAAATA